MIWRILCIGDVWMLNWLKPWCKGGFMNDSDGAGEEISAKEKS
jgi:hypothetical protein